jgi:hypothetical protein
MHIAKLGRPSRRWWENGNMIFSKTNKQSVTLCTAFIGLGIRKISAVLANTIRKFEFHKRRIIS